MDWLSLILADIARLLQYAGATVLFGAALFTLTGLPRSGEASVVQQGWPKPLFVWAAVVLLAGTVLSLLAQSATMNGVPLNKLDPAAIQTVLDTQWGNAIVVRICVSLAALIVALGPPSRARFSLSLALGLIALASFAFTGHGVADDGLAGLVHLTSDMLHAVAAGVWLGALAGFFILLRRTQAIIEPHRTALASALANFATIGTATVAVLVVTGLVNGFFLIGFAGLPKILTSAYGDLLMLKLVLFVAMLGLAGANRFRLTPALQQATDVRYQAQAVARLRHSVTLEALAGLAILALVAAFGMLEPPMAM